MNAVFSVDLEEDLHTGKFEGIEFGIPKLEEILNRYNIKATFFVTGETLKKYPQTIISLNKKGHEIALHSYAHERYDSLTSAQKEEDLKKCIALYLKILKKSPRGFRAPQHSIDDGSLEILYKNGFWYDSSKTSGNIFLLRHLAKKNSSKKEVLKNFLSSFKPFKIKGDLWEVPRAAFLISIGAFELKIFPKMFYKAYFLLSKFFGTTPLFVMHSWDLIDIPRSRTSRFCSSEKFLKRLDKFLAYTSKKTEYITIENLLGIKENENT